MRLVDADEVKKYTKERWSDFLCSAYDFVRLVDSVPTIEERKKGKWIDKSDCCVCNQCGHMEQQFNGVEPIPLHTPFCAMCGADMKEESK